MKKLASLLVVAGMLFLSCGNKNVQEEEVAPEEEPVIVEEEPVQEDTAAVEAAQTEEAAPAAETKTTAKKATTKKNTVTTAKVGDDSKTKNIGSPKDIDTKSTITLQPVDNSKKSSEPATPAVSGGKEIKF